MPRKFSDKLIDLRFCPHPETKPVSEHQSACRVCGALFTIVREHDGLETTTRQDEA